MNTFRHCTFAALIAVVLPSYATDATQFRGPNRDGIFEATGLLKAWPETGPPLLWTAEGLGEGYASATCAGGSIYVPGMTGDREGHLFVLDEDGNHLWNIAYGEETLDKFAPGSRSTVTIEDNRAYLVSGMGVVNCIDIEKRDIVWQVDMLKRFDGKMITWSIAESPLIYKDTLICTPGGPDASLAALDKMTGETVWSSKGLSDASAYCSPNVFTHGGRDIIATMTARYVAGVDAKTGEVLWTHEHPSQNDIHANTPVYHDGMVYFAAGSESGSGALALSADGTEATVVWKDTTLDCFHGGFVEHEGYVYGTTHRSGKEMICQDLATGKIMWRSEEVTEGAIVFAEGMLYIYEGPKAGVVHLVEATPKQFNRTGMFSITEGSAKHWAHPTIANGTLYIRRGEFLFAYNISEN